MSSFAEWAQRGWSQVVTHGLWTTLSGMLVVFVALTLISLAIAVLPRLLRLLDYVLPSAEEPEHAATPARKSPSTAEDEVLVAIAFALHTELQRRNG